MGLALTTHPKMIATEKSRLANFAEKLRRPGREEDQRMKDLQNAIELVTEQLVIFDFFP